MGKDTCLVAFLIWSPSLLTPSVLNAGVGIPGAGTVVYKAFNPLVCLSRDLVVCCVI